MRRRAFPVSSTRMSIWGHPGRLGAWGAAWLPAICRLKGLAELRGVAAALADFASFSPPPRPSSSSGCCRVTCRLGFNPNADAVALPSAGCCAADRSYKGLVDGMY
ncbi:protein of unknown function [Pseudorhizobium banfieldiae]|uniref:Uncharacterized protein n=1 Tax=Pseudorhizobium banfieldiae TaxID=1125847 RepID=L0NKX1_9HYPH|nr:protein of unknown function [Pseudorhizobium banfieldiae]